MAAPARTNNKKRILILFLLCGVIFLTLAVRLGWIMLVDGEEYSNKAVEQQTKDTPISAERGAIYDRNMSELAVNAPNYTVWVRPAELKNKDGDPSDMAEILADITVGAAPEGEDAAAQHALSLQETAASIEETLKKESALVRVAKNLTTEQAEQIRKYMQKGKLPGISVEEGTKRYYPYGDFASVLIGHTTDDGDGISGVELSYNNYLSGKSGRIIRNTDASGRQLAYGTEKYYEAEDGLNIVLTVDEVMQHYMEKALARACEDTQSKRSMGIAMDPDTGEILSTAIYPGYDLNNPRVPSDAGNLEEYNALETDEERVAYWNKMWRNSLISDTYEPGSTFKLITTSIALEEGLTSTTEGFYCGGGIQLYDRFLKCHVYPRGHGQQSLAQAMQHSCNPVFATLGTRIGAKKYFEYIDTFGFSQKTGIDLNGETSAIMYERDKINPVDLAVMSYGQGISVTPMQLITAVSSIVNGGKLMTPHVVKEVQNNSREVIYKNEPKMVRRTVSEQTSAEMRDIMLSVVEEGTGSKAYIAGYKLGGKTGTADKVVNGRYAKGKVYSSFICVAPADDPEIVVLFIVDEPVGVHYASTVVVPYVRDFLSEALVYMQVEPDYNTQETQTIETGTLTVQNLCGHTVAEATKMLENQGLKAIVMPETVTDTSLKVVDQYPKYLTRVNAGSSVYLYTE